MATFNANYQIIPLTGGTYNTGELGDGITASTVHEIHCLTTGVISITAIGGGTASFQMSRGESVKVLVGSVTITSGTYVGFKSKYTYGSIAPVQWGGNS